MPDDDAGEAATAPAATTPPPPPRPTAGALLLVRRNPSSGRFETCPDALQALRDLSGPADAVAVCGRARTGKSLLINRLAAAAAASSSAAATTTAPPPNFPVGSTQRACTHGIWMWAGGVTADGDDDSSGRIVFLDCEGTDAAASSPSSSPPSSSSDRDADAPLHAARLFALASAVSSVVLYNSSVSIDEAAVEGLARAAALARQWQRQRRKRGQQDDNDDENGDETTPAPALIWVIRDAFLRLEDARGRKMTPSECLEAALAADAEDEDDQSDSESNDADTDDAEAELARARRATARRTIRILFPERAAVALVRPAHDEAALAALDSGANGPLLRPEFSAGVRALERQVSAAARRSRERCAMTGPGLAALVEAYVHALNAGIAEGGRRQGAGAEGEEEESGAEAAAAAATWRAVARRERRRAAAAAAQAYAAVIGETIKRKEGVDGGDEEEGDGRATEAALRAYRALAVGAAAAVARGERAVAAACAEASRKRAEARCEREEALVAEAMREAAAALGVFPADDAPAAAAAAAASSTRHPLPAAIASAIDGAMSRLRLSPNSSNSSRWRALALFLRQALPQAAGRALAEQEQQARGDVARVLSGLESARRAAAEERERADQLKTALEEAREESQKALARAARELALAEGESERRERAAIDEGARRCAALERRVALGEVALAEEKSRARRALAAAAASAGARAGELERQCAASREEARAAVAARCEADVRSKASERERVAVARRAHRLAVALAEVEGAVAEGERQARRELRVAGMTQVAVEENDEEEEGDW
jgi:hypothetical protein